LVIYQESLHDAPSTKYEKVKKLHLVHKHVPLSVFTTSRS